MNISHLQDMKTQLWLLSFSSSSFSSFLLFFSFYFFFSFFLSFYLFFVSFLADQIIAEPCLPAVSSVFDLDEHL